MPMKLETIEWTQTWYEQTAPQETPRVLLIGDSISVGYRSVVHRELQSQYFVTAFSTSKALDNPYLLDEIALCARQGGFPYAQVHVNNGLHGWHLTDEAYAAAYAQFVVGLRDLFPQARLSLALSTEYCQKTEAGFEPHPEKNPIVERRNEIVSVLAAKEQLPLDDLYRVSQSVRSGHTPDGVHFTQEGYESLGKAIAAFLLTI